MRLVKFVKENHPPGFGTIKGDEIVPFSERDVTSLFEVLEADDPGQMAEKLIERGELPIKLADVQLLPPIDQQEVWAAGVTYIRSKAARMEESDAAADCYDRVYQSDRPELFFKATPARVSGSGQPLKIRKDSQWNVPEPEFALAINSRGKIVGATIGNDMSSRDIEGANPLYLPQAKVYDKCCGLGPFIALTDPYWREFPDHNDIQIRLEILRQGAAVFQGDTNLGQLARKLEDLVGYLFRDQSFPHGAFLLTGTGIIPPNDFTLAVGDVVAISISGLGTLINEVIQD